MKSLGNMLRRHIDKNGYTIYKAAMKAGINRTTLQKVLADDRSASEDMLQKLLSILNLSPGEKAEIWKTFEIMQTGEAIYHQRQCIKELIESTASLDHFFYSYCTDTEQSMNLSPVDLTVAEKFPSSLPVLGIHNVEHLLSSLLIQECQCSASSMSSYDPALPLTCLSPGNQILISAPGNLPLLKQLFIHDLPSCHDRTKIELLHITSLMKSSASPSLPLDNLEILSNILPFTISQAFHYEVYCFYRDELLLDSLHYAFPYFIIFSNAVILLSCDGQTALPFTEPAAISYFRDLFFASLKKSSPLITTCSSPVQVLENLLETDHTPRPFQTIEYQPCLTTFLTEKMLLKYARPDIPMREELIQDTMLRIRQLSDMSHHCCIFSKAGLTEFAMEGTVSDLPPFYMNALDIPDRIRLLKSLYLACKKDREFLRLVNPVTFSIPKHMSFVIRGGHSIDFTGFNSQGTGYNYVHITEAGILEAFEDFYTYLMKSNLIYTKDETLRDIEALLIGLSSKLY